MFQNNKNNKTKEPFQAYAIKSKTPIPTSIHAALTKTPSKSTTQQKTTTQVPLKPQTTNVITRQTPQPVKSEYLFKKKPKLRSVTTTQPSGYSTNKNPHTSVTPYDYQVEPAQKRLKTNAYPTMMKKTTGALSQATSFGKPIEKTKIDASLKVFTVTIDNLREYSKHQKANAVLFEVYAQLDSTVVEYGRNSRQFSIKDDYDRMQCIFYEMDRQLPKFLRGSYLRCIGRYNFKRSNFICTSVRQANESELFNLKNSIAQTNRFIMQYF